MVLPKGTTVREATVEKPIVLDHDIQCGIVLQTDRRVWVKEDGTGRIYVLELELPTNLE